MKTTENCDERRRHHMVIAQIVAWGIFGSAIIAVIYLFVKKAMNERSYL
jgi:hypothetical protein